MHALTVSDAGGTVSEQLVEAIGVLHHRNPAHRSTEPLIAYLRHAVSISEVELVGIAKASVAPTTMRKQLVDTVHVEIMRSMGRLGLSQQFPQVAHAMKPHFDAAMCGHFGRLKAGGVCLQVFFECHA